MSKKPENPNAFPYTFVTVEDDGATDNVRTGMTLRDWFAGQALQGVIWSHCISSKKRATYEAIAEEAYAIADAHLAERRKGN